MKCGDTNSKHSHESIPVCLQYKVTKMATICWSGSGFSPYSCISFQLYFSQWFELGEFLVSKTMFRLTCFWTPDVAFMCLELWRREEVLTTFPSRCERGVCAAEFLMCATFRKFCLRAALWKWYVRRFRDCTVNRFSLTVLYWGRLHGVWYWRDAAFCIVVVLYCKNKTKVQHCLTPFY